MKTLFTLTLINLCIPFSLSGQSEKFAEEMKSALYIHDTASVISSEILALNSFKKLSDKYPNEWLPHYWTAYLCTQVGRLEYRVQDFPKGLSGDQLYIESKVYLEKAITAKGEMTNIERSDILVLDGFIDSFLKETVDSDVEKAKYDSLSKYKYIEAIQLNPQNPLMYVFRGIALGSKDDYRDVFSGIGLLNHAEKIFNEAENRALTTYWNKDFIAFWRSRAEAKLTKILEEEAKNKL